MARPKKVLDNMTGHWTKEQIEQKKAEENLIKIDAKNIQAPSWLKGKIAKAEFNRLAKLLLEIEVVNELDITSLAVYCENYERLIKVTKELETEELVINGRINPKMKLKLQLQDELRKLGNELGINLSARLKFASVKVQEEKDELLDILNSQKSR